MGKVENGILGPITGKVSNLIWYQLKGKNLVRVAGKRCAPLTRGEKLNTNKMRVLMEFFKSIKPFLKAGFGHAARGTNLNYHNVATSYNRKNAITVVDGLPKVNFESVLLSMGVGAGPQQVSVELIGNALNYNWNWNPQEFEAAEDQVMMLAYMPDKNISVFETAGAKRKAGQDNLPLLNAYLQERMEIFVSFISKDRSGVANSVYLGRIN
jgi:hypothetical protein